MTSSNTIKSSTDFDLSCGITGASLIRLNPRNLRGNMKYSRSRSKPRKIRLSFGNSASSSSKPICSQTIRIGPAPRPGRRNHRGSGRTRRPSARRSARRARPHRLPGRPNRTAARRCGNRRTTSSDSWRRCSAISSSIRAAMRWVRLILKSGKHIRLDREPERLQRRRRGEIFRGRDIERPQRHVGAQPVAAGDLAVELAIGGVEIGAARDQLPVPQCRDRSSAG